MKQAFFILLWVFNTLGFCCAIFYTFCLIPLNIVFVNWFSWIGTSLCISYALAMAVISPHPLLFLSGTVAFFLLIALYLLLEAYIQHWRKHRTVPSEPRLSWFWEAWYNTCHFCYRTRKDFEDATVKNTYAIYIYIYIFCTAIMFSFVIYWLLYILCYVRNDFMHENLDTIFASNVLMLKIYGLEKDSISKSGSKEADSMPKNPN